MALLQGYSWPGNVRELENVIQRAIIVAKDTCISAADLPSNLLEEGVAECEDCPSTSSFERQIRDFKLRLAVEAVREHNGNKTLAARSLQISRAYLHRLIRPTGPSLVDQESLFLEGQPEQLGAM
jgi:transcriptional regulator with PAS, ATPase and Fis domain